MFGKTDIERYFAAEKSSALWIMILAGVIFLASFSIWLTHKSAFSKGLMIPTGLLLVMALVVGSTVYKRSDNDRKNMVYAFDMNPAKIQKQEIPRLEKLHSRFKILLAVELVLVIAGAVLVFLYYNKSLPEFLYGLGMGLLIAGLAALTVDYFASIRAMKYAEGLKSISAR